MNAEHSVSRFHLHLVSDATGETLTALAKAAITQFEGVEAIQHLWPLIRSTNQLEEVITHIAANPGVVLFTLVGKEVRSELLTACRRLDVPCVSILDPVLHTLGTFLGAESAGLPGRQHMLDAAYFSRIEAMDFTLAHDDGQSTVSLTDADVILVGVSRTSKTPTCLYLANRGVRAANVPIVPEQPLPAELLEVEGPLIVGLTAAPDRLVQIRQHRLLELNEGRETSYTDTTAVRDEVRAARQMFERHGWPIIDVTRRSIEETAAQVLRLIEAHRAA